jgi:hypothetical protein
MKATSVIFCFMLIFMLEINLHKTLRITQNSSSSMTNDEMLSKEDAQIDTTGQFKEMTISNDSTNSTTLTKSDNTDTSTAQKVEETSVSTIDSICKEYLNVKKAMDDLDIEAKELISRFNKHIELYKKWQLEATETNEIVLLDEKETKYLNDYLKIALNLDNLMTNLQVQLKEVENVNCPNQLLQNTDLNESSNQVGVQDEMKLVQMILQRFDKLDLKVDPKYASFVEKTKKNLRK